MPSEPRRELYEEIRPRAFSFGRNWRRFLDRLTPEQIDAAGRSLTEFLGVETLAGRTFLDVGCGSGLFSLAAYRLGASVTSVDVDPDSIACAELLREREGLSPGRWRIATGSALDESFLESLGQFDVVYSWGVLHHTGDLWRAVRNVARRVAPQGLFYVALYNEHRRFPSSAAWRRIKRLYARGGPLVRRPLEAAYFAAFFSALLLRGRNPLKYVRTYSARSRRGMSFYRDALDWLGGYPYEYATPEAVQAFCEPLGLETLKVAPVNSIGCNEFLFQRIGNM